MVTSEATSYTVVGIDPGLAITGYGIISVDSSKATPVVLEYGTVRTLAGNTLGERLDLLYSGISDLLTKYQPVVGGCEKIFFSKNVKTAIDVSQARGVIILALQQHIAKVFELTPTQIKQTITGYGSATKSQVQYMVQQHLKLKDLPTQDDAADALAIAIAVSTLTYKPEIL